MQSCQFVLGAQYHLANPEALSDALDSWRFLTAEHRGGNSKASGFSHGV